MPEFEVKIVRMADDSFPGFVECRFADASGREHTIIEKVPVVSAADVDAQSSLPLAGRVACEVEFERRDATDRRLLRVNTSRPYSIESICGENVFELVAERVSF
jgi:hypothetical protein